MDWPMVKAHQLIGSDCGHSIYPTIVVAELDFVDARSPILDHSADLAQDEPLVRQIRHKCHNRMHANPEHRNLSSIVRNNL